MPAISAATIHGKLSAPETLRGKLSCGSSVTTEPLSVTENGVYAAPRGTAYSPVTVDVPTPAPNLQSKTATPTEQQQTVQPDSGYDGLSSVTVDAIPPTYVGSGVTQRTSADLTASGATVTVPAGHYAQQASKAVASGTEGTPTATKGSVSNHAVTVTPSVTNSAGYIAGGTHTGTAITVSASELVSGSTTITENGTVDVTEYASVTVDVPTGGGGSEPDSGNRTDPIRFFDYDGRLVASYTSVPSAMPDVPTHDRLTNGTWNYTLAQVAEQFDAVGKCDVGANYDTASGCTEIDVKLDSAHLKPFLCFAINGTATIDWGDGNSETVTGTSIYNLEFFQHVYARDNEYTITIDGPIRLKGERNVPSILRTVDGTSDNRRKSAEYSSSITAVRLGANITSIGDATFYSCYALQSVTIPSSVTNIGNYAFEDCHALQSVTIPSGVTVLGDYVFESCYAMQSVTIPSSVTNIGNNDPFYGCNALQSVTIPAGVTRIAPYAFYGCHALQSVTIPSGVTSIWSYAFYGCYGTYEYHLLPTNPPTLGNTNAFTGIVAGTVIYVPQGSLEAYQTASNWSSYKDYMQEEA